MNELISTTQWKEDLEEDRSKRRGEEEKRLIRHVKERLEGSAKQVVYCTSSACLSPMQSGV